MRLARSMLVLGLMVVGAAAPQPAAAAGPGAMTGTAHRLGRQTERFSFRSLSSTLYRVLAWLHPFSAPSNRPIATAVQGSSFRESRAGKLQRGSVGFPSEQQRAQDGEKRRRHPASGNAASAKRRPAPAEHAKNPYRWPAERARTATAPTPASAQGGRPVAAASEPLHRALQGLLGLSQRAEEALPADPRAAFAAYQSGIGLLSGLLEVGPTNALSGGGLHTQLLAAAKTNPHDAAPALSAATLVKALTDDPATRDALGSLRTAWMLRMAVAHQHVLTKEGQPVRAAAPSLVQSATVHRATDPGSFRSRLGSLAGLFNTGGNTAGANAASPVH